MKKLYAILAASLLGSAVIAIASESTYSDKTIKGAIARASGGKSFKTPMSVINTGRRTPPSVSSTPRRAKLSAATSSMSLSEKATGLTNLFGYVTYNTNPNFSPGLLSVTSEGTSQVWKDDLYKSYSQTLYAGYLDNGVIHGYSPCVSGGYIEYSSYVEFDFKTGQNIVCEDLDGYYPYYNALACVPEENAVYGYGLSMKDGTNVWQKNSCDNMTATPDYIKVIESGEELCSSLGYCEADGKIYGVTAGAKFVQIDTDGTQHEIFDISDFSHAPYISGMVWMPAQQVFYWNMIRDDYSSAIVSIDPVAKAATIVAELDWDEELTVLFTTESSTTDRQAPKSPVIDSIMFPFGQRNGVVMVSMPSDLNDGTPIEGKVTCEIAVDGEVISSTEESAGQQAFVSLMNIASGMHEFSVTAVYDGHRSAPVSKMLFIGIDSPTAPKNVILSTTKVEWDPVSVGINGGYVDGAALTYHISLNGNEVGTTSDTYYEIELPSDGEMKVYTAEVYAADANTESEHTISNKVVAGTPLQLPFTVTPTEEQVEFCVPFDANNDDITWFYDEDEKHFRIKYTPENGGPHNDWLFLPPVELPEIAENEFLTLNFEAGRATSLPHLSDELLEVYIGKMPLPEEMTFNVVESFRPEAGFESISTLINGIKSGTYYIGFKCTSAEHQYGVMVKNISIEQTGVTVLSPDVPTNADAFAHENGKLKADVMFTFPTRTISDEEIPAETTLTAVVKAANEVTIQGKPGEDASVTVETAQGDNKIGIRIDSESGSGEWSYVNVYTGVVVPSIVENVVCGASEDHMTLDINWDPVTTGIDGGYVDPDDITYVICTPQQTMFGTTWIVLERIGKSTSYQFRPDKQEFIKIGIAAENAAGNSDITVVTEVAGLPYQLPLADDFEGASVDPLVTRVPAEDYDAIWNFAHIKDFNPALENSENVVIVAIPEQSDSKAMLGLPRFSTEGVEAVELNFSVLSGNGCPKIKILGNMYGIAQPIEIAEISHENTDPRFKSVTMALPAEMLCKKWAEILIDVQFDSLSQLFGLDSYSIKESELGSIQERFDNDNSSVSTSKNSMTLHGFAGKSVSVCSVNGQTIFAGTVETDRKELRLVSGIYIVSADGAAHKVIVK